jgi:tetratricopeptide (TPR) repeat protein
MFYGKRPLSMICQRGDWTAALEVIDRAIAEIPDHNGFKIAKLEVLLNTGEFTMANSLAEGLAEENWESAMDLNAIAWSLVTLSKEEADLELAQRIALRATSLTDDKNPSILDTVARVYFERGEVESAIAWQEKACALAPSNSALSKTLKRYLSLQTPLSVPEE